MSASKVRLGFTDHQTTIFKFSYDLCTQWYKHKGEGDVQLATFRAYNLDREVLTAFADDETSMFMHECEEFGTELR